MKITWTTYRGGHTYTLATINGKAYGRINRSDYWSGIVVYSATFLEWDEKKWPKEAFQPEHDFFAIRGDAFEVHIGNFKTEYQAKSALEGYIRREVK